MATFRFEYRDNGEAREFTFDAANITVGRGQSSDFVLDHPTVSRQHGMVVDDGGGQFRLVVLSESGFTAVDGQRVEGETTLYDGSQVHFGELCFAFRARSAPASSDAGRRGGRSRGEPASSGTTATGGSGSHEGAPGRKRGAEPGAESRRGEGAGERTSGQRGEGARTDGSGGREISGPGPVDEPDGGTRGSDRGPEDPRRAAGVESWDEIASEVDESSETSDPDSLSDQTVESDDRDEEQTNPALVAVAGVLIVGLLAFIFTTGGGGGGETSDQQGMEGEPYDIELRVDCLGPSDCLKSAKHAYAVGEENLEQRNVQIGNLYRGYEKLYEAKRYLEAYREAGGETEERLFPQLDAKLKEARGDLKATFRNFRVKYISDKRNQRYRGMAEALARIKEHFGEESRAYRWATEKERAMRDQGVYPAY